MGTTRLQLYNGALRELGETRLASLTENREPRRALDDFYDQAVNYCLEAGQWNFALRSVEFTANEDIEAEFGYTYTFDKPSDWIRTAALTSDEHGRLTLLQYQDESQYWFADINPIYVRYVSNDESFGLDLGAWPSRFTRFVELYLAYLACERLTQNATKRRELAADLKAAKKEALNSDAMNDAGPRFSPPGRVVRSRMGGWWHGRNYERG